jgi:hypothetical protein
MKAATRTRAASFAVIALVIGLAGACTTGGHGHGAPTPVKIYDSNITPLPGNVASQGFQCCQTAEFGDAVHFAGTARKLTSATVTMSDWAKYSTPANHSFPSADANGFNQLLTLNIYGVGPDDANGHATAGALLASVPQVFHIPWRPEDDPAHCPTPGDYGIKFQSKPGPNDTNCFNGLATKVTFNLSSYNVHAPNSIVWGVAFDTESYGANPKGSDGPYDSLNVGADGNAPSLGSELTAGAAFINSSTAGYYCDSDGVSTFRASSPGCWATQTPEISFSATN